MWITWERKEKCSAAPECIILLHSVPMSPTDFPNFRHSEFPKTIPTVLTLLSPLPLPSPLRIPLPFSMLSLVPLHLPTFAVTFTLRGSAGHIVLLYVFLHVFLYNLCFPQQLYKLQCISGLGNTPDGKQQNFPNLSLFVPAVYLERNLTFTRILFALPVDLSK